MKKQPRIQLRDLERETKKFLAPSTEKERAIIEAAVELLAERGIDGATTAEIAKRAKVTERTLFRYFPSKRDLIRRVLFPLLLRGGLPQKWETFEGLLKTKNPDFRDWYVKLAEDRLANISKNPGLSRTVLVEVLQNQELREAIAVLWRQHIWEPMVQSLEAMRATGTIRKEVDVEVLARAIHCLHVGYFLARYVFAPDHKWDDEGQIAKMAELLTNGSIPDAKTA